MKPIKTRVARKGSFKGDELGPCPACGKTVVALIEGDGWNGLAHPSLAADGTFGPNGETGCARFDAIGANVDDMAAYVREMRETITKNKPN